MSRKKRNSEAYGHGQADPWEALAAAIIKKAVDDYKVAPKKKNWQRAVAIEKFFRSDYFGKISSLDPEYLIKNVRADVLKGAGK